MTLPVIRPAHRSDAHEIARLFLMSSDGLAKYIWSRLPDAHRESPLTVGARRYARDGVDFSWQNCLMAERDGRTAGMLHSFPMAATADEAATHGRAESDPVLRPYAELEDPGSLYVSGVAVHPAWRGRGIGGALMAAAETRAQALGLPRLSLICFEANEGALRLYRRLGYREIARRAIVPHPMLHYCEGDALLLVKPLVPVRAANDGAVAVAGASAGLLPAA